MKCPKCDSKNTISFFNESMDCAYCGQHNEITCHLCKECNLVWKAVEDILVDGMVFSPAEVEGIFDTFPSAIEKDIAAEFGPKGPTKMVDMLHTCIRCDARAFEYKDGTFFCPKCGFEWETE